MTRICAWILPLWLALASVGLAQDIVWLKPPAPRVQLYTLDYAPGVRLEGSESFVRDTAAVLDGMAELPTGSRLLNELGTTGFQTTIRALDAGPVTGAQSPYAFATDKHVRQGVPAQYMMARAYPFVHYWETPRPQRTDSDWLICMDAADAHYMIETASDRADFL